jgi:Flp pilus assembly protein TadB
MLMTRTFLGSAAEQGFAHPAEPVPRCAGHGVALGARRRASHRGECALSSREAQTPTREEFSKAADQVSIGLDLENALLEMAERNDLSEYRFFATALALQSQTGGGLTETLETLADTIRKRENARKRGHALASEARTSIYVLAALPIVVGAMLFVINPDYIGLLFTDTGGQKLLGIAVRHAAHRPLGHAANH